MKERNSKSTKKLLNLNFNLQKKKLNTNIALLMKSSLARPSRIFLEVNPTQPLTQPTYKELIMLSANLPKNIKQSHYNLYGTQYSWDFLTIIFQ